MKRLSKIIVVAVLIVATICLFRDKKTDHEIYCENIEKVTVLIDRLNTNVDWPTRNKIANSVYVNATRHAIDPKNLIAIAYVESGLDPKAINTKSGDFGLCQINFKTWHRKYNLDKKRLLNIDENVKVACDIISDYRSRGIDDIAAYHSMTELKKEVYEAKLNEAFRKMRI